MSRPRIHTPRPSACVVPRPARLMSRRAVLAIWAIHAAWLVAAALHTWLGAGS